MISFGQDNWMDKLFHKKLSGYEVLPEDHVWESIAKRLDDSQRRPGLFGSWWTVLLSIILFLMVTGAGAYMLYKRYYNEKKEKSQNKDLPYRFDENNDEGTAYLSGSPHRTVVSTPKRTNFEDIKTNGISKNSTDNNILIDHSNNQTNTHSSDFRNHTSKQEYIETVSDKNQNQTISEKMNPVMANDLIVSSDTQFFTTRESNAKAFSYSYLPLKESFLKKEKEQLSSPRIIDGCNVYKDDKTHFFLDVYYAPSIASRSLETNDPSLKSYVEERAQSEQPILSYSVGARASFVFSNGLSVRGGLSYSNNSERFDFIKEIQKITTVIKDQNGNVIRTEVKENVIMDKIYNRYTFVDIPLLVGYEKDLNDFVLSLNGGIGLNISATQSGKIYKNDTNKMSFYQLESNGEANEPIFRKNAGVSFIGSVGLNYKYNERVMLLLEPSARYYLHSLSDPDNPVSQKYLFLGLNVGLRYRLK
jgi:hypothetical protein